MRGGGDESEGVRGKVVGGRCEGRGDGREGVRGGG